MKKIFSTLLLSLLCFTLFASPCKAHTMGKNTFADKITVNKSSINLTMEERKLWIDHVSWTRSFIISDLASLDDKDAVLQRLLKNQDDIGASIKPYYGEEAAKKLSELLREHIKIGGQVVDAAKSNNKDDLEKYDKLWHKNADEIAKFLSSANPNWSNATLQDMLYKHLKLVTDQVVARINKDWKSDIEAYDKGEDHMIMFADTISNGIVKQFPDKFK